MYRSVTKEEISKRLNRFQDKLTAHEVDGAIIVQKTDLYYLSGTDQDAHLWVPASGQPLLMVRKSMDRAQEDSPIETVVPLHGLSHLPELIRQHGGELPKQLGLEMDILPAAFYLSYQRLFPDAELVDISPLIRGVRMIKSDYEISCITRAAEMADHMYEKAPGFLAEAVTETDLALRIEAFYRGMGHPGLVRTRSFNMECIYGQVMSGKNGAVPSNSAGPTGGRGLGPFYSQSAGMEKIGQHEPVIVDYAANVEGYIADQARIFSIGRLGAEFHEAHDVMLEVQEAIAEQGKPGVRAEDLYNMALEIVEKAGFKQGFMGYPDPVPFVAHGVGLDIDEWPVIGRRSDTRLREGMTIALEPKIVIPGKGVVGIENTWLVTAHGMKKLNRFPDTIFECC
ncbi:MAG: aminopeptidase P family protein [Desulfobacteraceae bacterium]|nr:aminopeptidase P family protein [Desulfobacteraceae bacterium]